MSQAETEALLDAIGRRIAEIRTTRGWTQAEFAELLEVATRYVQSVEHGQENLTVDSLQKFAKALGVEVKEFFEPPATRRPGRGRPKKSVATPPVEAVPLAPRNSPK